MHACNLDRELSLAQLFRGFYLQSNVKGAKDALADVDCLQLNFVRSLNQLELAIMVQFVLALLSFGVN